VICIDLEEFAASGVFGPFDCGSTRQMIEQILGPSDSSDYPDFMTYGHVNFDLASTKGPPCRIQVDFPHPANQRRSGVDQMMEEPRDVFSDWPDRRFEWRLGRFKPGLTLNDALAAFDLCVDERWSSRDDELSVLCIRKSPVWLHFEKDGGLGLLTLASMVAHPTVRNACEFRD
jgi:hypothetical protein